MLFVFMCVKEDAECPVCGKLEKSDTVVILASYMHVLSNSQQEND